MRRHPRLAPLSRHHHDALVQGRALRELAPSAAAAAEGFLAFWRRGGADHFRREEEVLLPWFARYGDPGHPAVARMLAEHARIRAAAMRLAEGPVPDPDLRALGVLLSGHVRLEEDEVFPLIERTLPEAALAAIDGLERESEGSATERIADSVVDLIGGTPLLRLHRVAPAGGAEICLKLEGQNPAGSVKDRTAWSMVRDAERRGLLQPGATIVEPTSGNTGIGLAMVAAARGYRLVIVLPGDANPERVAFLKAYGAEVVLGPEGGGMTGAIERARAIVAERPGAFLPMQFENPANPAIHRETTAVEIVEQTGGRLDALVATAGTGGTVTGCGTALHALLPGVRVYAVEPAASPVLSGGKPGKHGIPGMGPGFVPAIVDRAAFDAILQVTDDEARTLAGRLAREEGVFVGLSSGASVAAACRVAAELGAGRRVVAIAPDSGDRYFSSGAYGAPEL